LLCIWGDQKGIIYYEMLKPVETVDAHHHQQQLIKLHRVLCEKRPNYQQKHDMLIFFHNNASLYTSNVVRNYLETLNWEVLAHPADSVDLAPSDYHLFSSMSHALAEQIYDSYENVRKWFDEWFPSKKMEFFWRGIHKLPDRWEKCVVSKNLHVNLFLLSIKKHVYF